MKDRLIGLAWLVGAIEHAVKGVVIGRGHRIKLVIMAARAIHGQAHGAAGDHVDAVIDNFLSTGHARAEGEEAQRCEVRIRIALLNLVRGDLVNQKLVVGHIVIECLDYPVAVGVRINVTAQAAAAVVAAGGIRIAGHVQPVAAPAFAVLGHVQQPVNHLLVGFLAVNESLHVIKRRRNTNEVKINAPQ